METHPKDLVLILCFASYEERGESEEDEEVKHGRPHLYGPFATCGWMSMRFVSSARDTLAKEVRPPMRFHSLSHLLRTN